MDIRKEVRDVIIETSEDIAELNRGQLFLGKRSDGKPIKNLKRGSEEYSSWWGDYRASLGLQTDHFDLNVTRQFWDSIEVDVRSEVFEVLSNDDKYDDLVKMFSERILGLSDASKSEEYIPNYFFPALKARIERKLGVKFR